MEIQSDSKTGNQRDHPDNRRNRKRRALAVNEEAENNGHDNEQQRNHRNGGVIVIESAVRSEAVEGVGYNRSESGDNQDQGQIREDDEQLLRTLADIGGNHLADRLAFVADRGKERAEIVHRTKEDAARSGPTA